MADAWGMNRTHCPHCNSPRISRHGSMQLICHDCKIPCSKFSTEKAVRNWQIVQLYTVNKLNTLQIAKMLKLGETTVNKILHNYNVEMRPIHRYDDKDREMSLATRQHRANNRQKSRSMELQQAD